MYQFDNDIDSQPLDGHEPLQLAAQVTDNWSINGLPNGGYQMALLANAMLRQSSKTSLAILSATFIARCEPGNARLGVEKIAVSSQFERYMVRLAQEGNEKIRAWGTFVDVDKGCTIDRYEAAPPAIAPLDQCQAIPQMPKYTLFDQVDARMDPACIGWMFGKPADRSEHKGWIKFKDDRPLDAVSILLMADAFPPPVYASQGLGGWVPTIEMSVNIRKLPASQWLKCIFRTRFITCGLMEEDGQLWDEAGELVAISRQISQYRK